jgi:hypothetical protein
MRKILAVAAVVWCIVGCTNDNKLVIQNDADVDINVNFRATATLVPAHTPQTIPDIPNGTYTYDISVPPVTGATIASVPGSGSIEFQKKATKWLFILSSTVSDNVYSITLSKSTSDDASSTTITSP